MCQPRLELGEGTLHLPPLEGIADRLALGIRREVGDLPARRLRRRPPAAFAPGLRPVFLDVAEPLELAQVVARGAARLAGPPGELSGSRRSVETEQAQQADAQWMDDRAERPDVGDALGIGGHADTASTAKTSLQVVLCD